MKYLRFSLRTLLLLTATIGAAGLVYSKRDPWRIWVTLKPANPALLQPNALAPLTLPLVVYSPERQRLAVVFGKKDVFLYDLRNHREIAEWSFPTGTLEKIVEPLPPTSHFIALLNNEKARVYELDTGKVCATLRVHNPDDPYPAFSRDGRYILQLAERKTIEIVRTDDGKPISPNEIPNLDHYIDNEFIWTFRSLHIRKLTGTATAEQHADWKSSLWVVPSKSEDVIWAASFTESVQAWKRVRPDGWIGFLYLPELWLSLLFLGGTVYSFILDHRKLTLRPTLV